jgi:hypothetical protein
MTDDHRYDVIVAIIGAMAAVVAALVGPAAFDRLFYPVVEVALNGTIGEYSERTNLTITITNYGSNPATNLALYIKSPYSNFIGITNSFSTANISIRNLTDGSLKALKVNESINVSALKSTHYLELYTPNFVPGTGSKAVLTLQAKPLNWTDFEASAVYDQGSVVWVSAGGFTYKGFVDNISKPAHIIEIVAIGVFVSWYFSSWAYFMEQPLRSTRQKSITITVIVILVIMAFFYELVVYDFDTLIILLVAGGIVIGIAVGVLWKVVKPTGSSETTQQQPQRRVKKYTSDGKPVYE